MFSMRVLCEIICKHIQMCLHTSHTIQMQHLSFETLLIRLNKKPDILDFKIMTVVVFSRGVKIGNGCMSSPGRRTDVDSLQWWNDELLRRPWANRTTSCQTLFVDCNLFVKSDLSKGHPSFRMWSCVGFSPLVVQMYQSTSGWKLLKYRL